MKALRVAKYTSDDPKAERKKLKGTELKALGFEKEEIKQS